MTINHPVNSEPPTEPISRAPGAVGSRRKVPSRRPKAQRIPSGLQRAAGLPLRLLRQTALTWQLWMLIGIGTVGATGVISFLALVRLPQTGECPRVFWPLASASQRIYCAQAAAEQKTKRGLLDAIALVDALPKDHPLRPMADNYIRKWAVELIEVSEELFQQGKLSEALEAVKRIPRDRLPCTEDDCPAKRLDRRTKRWKDIWGKAEKIFKEAEKALVDQEWNKAAEVATLLLSVENRYWQTVKYEEISQQIADVRGNNSQLAKARDLAERGGLNNVLEAIKIANAIPAKSRLYPVAQGAIVKFSRQLLTLAEEALERKELDESLEIVDNIPSRANLNEDVKDFKLLARAEAKTWSGRIPDIQAAIVEARILQPKRPLYNRAQKSIAEWQTAIEDIARLDRARQMASGGRIPDLMSAIAEVSLIPKSNPRWSEAQQLITNWQVTIETQEDQPLIDRADQLAQGGNAPSYQAAIAEISRIRQGRALYSQAQERLKDWRSKLEWMEDQPYLTQARSLAMSGNLREAIAAASQIQKGRALFQEAQADLSNWQAQVAGEDNLARARQIAQEAQGPRALLRAIDTANQVPRNTAMRYSADTDIDNWSNQILQMAIDRSSTDLYAAIEMARLVPQETSAYSSAQGQISSWQAQLQEAAVQAAPVQTVPEPAPPPIDPPPPPPF